MDIDNQNAAIDNSFYKHTADKNKKRKKVSIGLIIEGHPINTIINDPEMLEIFLSVVRETSNVIICRASPSQKAIIVTMIQEHLIGDMETCIAIGDGSNDVTIFIFY